MLDLAWVLVIHAAYGDLDYPARQADYPRASDCTPTTWTNTALLCCLRLSFCSLLHTPLISAFASLCSCPVVNTSSLGLVPSFLLSSASSLFYDAYLRFRCHRTGVHSCICFCCFCSNACLQCCLKCQFGCVLGTILVCSPDMTSTNLCGVGPRGRSNAPSGLVHSQPRYRHHSYWVRQQLSGR